MNKLELVKVLRTIAKSADCNLSLRAASKIASWLKDGTAYDIQTWIEKTDKQKGQAICDGEPGPTKKPDKIQRRGEVR